MTGDEARALLHIAWRARRTAGVPVTLGDPREGWLRTHGEGSVSGPCRRGDHRFCKSGECECNCHIPAFPAAKHAPGGNESRSSR